MSETKFTPGPWSVEQPMDFELAIVEAGKPAHEWRFIATCMFPDENGDIPKKEVIANAHLIAAIGHVSCGAGNYCIDVAAERRYIPHEAGKHVLPGSIGRVGQAE